MTNELSLKSISGRENLSSRVYKILRQKVTHDELIPGEIYSISAIASQLNVSRSPVNDACQRLAAEGFLKILPKQGILITPITLSLARESYEMRAAIETYMVRHTFSHYTKKDVEILEENCEKQKYYVEHLQIPEFMDMDIAFHKYLIKKHENAQANSLMDTLYIRAFQIGIKVSKTQGRLVQSYEEHLKIIDGIKNEDADETVKWIEANIINGYLNLTGTSNYGMTQM